MMLRKSASVIEYSPPDDALVLNQKQISAENRKGNSLEEGSGSVFVDIRRHQSSPTKAATFANQRTPPTT